MNLQEHIFLAKKDRGVTIVVITSLICGLLLTGVAMKMWHWESFPSIITGSYLVCGVSAIFLSLYSLGLHFKGKFYIEDV